MDFASWTMATILTFLTQSTPILYHVKDEAKSDIASLRIWTKHVLPYPSHATFSSQMRGVSKFTLMPSSTPSSEDDVLSRPAKETMTPSSVAAPEQSGNIPATGSPLHSSRADAEVKFQIRQLLVEEHSPQCLQRDNTEGRCLEEGCGKNKLDVCMFLLSHGEHAWWAHSNGQGRKRMSAHNLHVAPR